MSPYASFLILGVIQGFTEFLPISSTGHLVLAKSLLHLNPPGIVTEIALHLATLVAVFVYYRRDVAALLTGRKLSSLRAPKAYLWLVAIATAATALLIFPFRDVLAGLTSGRAALVALVFTFSFTALLMFLADWLMRRPRVRAGEVTSVGMLPAIAIGIVQAVAALPGVSRSGSTIVAGIAVGLKREEAARFSFMLYIPISLLAVAWECLKLFRGSESFPPSLLGPMVIGFIVAFICGLVAIRLLLAVLERARLSWFGIYLIALAAFTAVLARL
jgi:undecaprenyl-diphosphatase